jgi:cell wall-associated NlpC family hydrolase
MIKARIKLGGTVLKKLSKVVCCVLAIAICLLVLAVDSTAYAASLLREGSRGNEVTKLQQVLYNKGYIKKSHITGYYGPITREAVKKFQRDNGLKADGIVGKNTSARMFNSSSASSRGSARVEANIGLDSSQNIIDFAMGFVGKPYRYGASGPNAFDCSGFTTYVYKKFGVKLPRSANSQAHGSYGMTISKNQLRPGDLVFFKTTSNNNNPVNHAGLYIGNGKFIHASSSKRTGGVKVSSLNSGFYQRCFKWGKRIDR